MQGLWKSKRKHFLKDKKRLIRKFGRNDYEFTGHKTNENIFKENKYMWTEEIYEPRSLFLEVFILKRPWTLGIETYLVDPGFGRSLYYQCAKNHTFVEYASSVDSIYSSWSVIKMEIKEVHFNDSEKNYCKWGDHIQFRTKEFWYNKEAPSKFKIHYDTQRKYWANRANRLSRRYMKRWLSLKDHEMDIEPKTNGLQKSIAWELS